MPLFQLRVRAEGISRPVVQIVGVIGDSRPGKTHGSGHLHGGFRRGAELYLVLCEGAVNMGVSWVPARYIGQRIGGQQRLQGSVREASVIIVVKVEMLAPSPAQE